MAGIVRIEALNKENHDTWKLQMQALLIKNDAWAYVSGESVKPELVAGNAASESAVKLWTINDNKAKSDIILSINPSELKQIKNCEHSRDVWLKLESIYQSKGPARKATLLKQLTLQRMETGGDVREHINKFFDAVDKLSEMDVDIHPDLLSIMLLYSLPSNYENFRCAIESRDELPTPEILRIKIVEENDARADDGRNPIHNALIANRNTSTTRFKKYSAPKKYNSKKNVEFKFRCHRCGIVGHKAADCPKKQNKNESEFKRNDETSFCVSVEQPAKPHAFCAANLSNSRWCLDSGATSHLSNSINKFVGIKVIDNMELNLANNSATEVTAKGEIVFSANVLGETKTIRLDNALHVPDLRQNLLSVGKITDKGYSVTFRKNTATINDSKGVVKLVADRVDGLYIVRETQTVSNNNTRETACSSKETLSLESWHRRLGHANQKTLLDAVRNQSIQGIYLERQDGKFECDVCAKGKMTRKPFTKRNTRSSQLLEIIHSDVCGPMRVESHGRAKYFVTFIDDHSRWCEVRFLRAKNEVFKAFIEYKVLVENLKERRIKHLQSDNGTEYKNAEFDAFIAESGIVRRLSIPYHPEQNGTAERKNRTLLDTARCLLIQSGLPSSFWAEAVSTANYIRNRTPSSSLNGKTPHELWTGHRPNVEYFQEFGCKAFCLATDPGRGKLDSRGKPAIFVGYSESAKGFRMWLTEERKIIVSRDVKFVNDRIGAPTTFEDFIPEESYEKEERTIEVELTPAPNQGLEYNENVVNDEPALDGNRHPDRSRKGRGRPRKVRSGLRGRPRLEYQRIEENQPEEPPQVACLAEVPIKQAFSGEDAKEWHRAIGCEVRSILKNDTWSMVDRPKKEEIIGSRFVLRNKYDSQGMLERRKARLVAKGYAQRPGVHFNETFAPVARMSSIRLLTALAAREDMCIKHLDITTAYLNGEISEKLYMEPPEFLEEALESIIKTETENNQLKGKARIMLTELRNGDKVCRLQKSLYGLRQAGRNWYTRLDKSLRKLGAKPTNADPCVYTLRSNGTLSYIIIYVDDILIMSGNQGEPEEIRRRLATEFEVKDLGNVQYCLGIEFSRKGRKISLNQRGYIKDILKRFGMEDANPVSTPMDANTKLSIPERNIDEMRKLPFRELIGSLMYLAICTRPDIAHAVSYLSQFNDNYSKAHWTAGKRILKYLKGTIDLGISYDRSSALLRGYVDSDWGGCHIDRRSYTGYVFTLCGGPVAWESRKQRTVALSSTEAEYMALTEATKETIFLNEFLIELGFKGLVSGILCNDNAGAKRLAENTTYHARSKHIDIRHHFVREAIRNGRITVHHISTEDMAADIMTKALQRMKHWKCAKLLGLGGIEFQGNAGRSSSRGSVRK